VVFFAKLADYVDRETFATKVEPTIINMFVDPVFMIREESANTVIKLSKKLFDAAWLERIMSTKLDELVRHERFMLRIQTLHLINQLKEHIAEYNHDRIFARHVFALAVDPVPNIRFNVSKTIANLFGNFQAESKARAKEILQVMAASDTDFDAKFFAQKTLDGLQGRVNEAHAP